MPSPLHEGRKEKWRPKVAATQGRKESDESRRGSAGEGIDYGGEKDDHSGKIIADGKDKGAVYDHLEGRRRWRWVQGGAAHDHRHGGGFGALLIDFDKIFLHYAH